jgi:peptidoglycan LD-endopeptidase LytH
MLPQSDFVSLLQDYQTSFHSVVPYTAGTDKLLELDFTVTNTDLTSNLVNNIADFTLYIEALLKNAGARYGIGGYNENRTVYNRSELFNATGNNDEPRSLHLGIDIWGEAKTAVMAPLDGIIHSFAFNNQLGDYGATIILEHQLNKQIFYTLYGHLSLDSLQDIKEGDTIKVGTVFATFGIAEENGYWPPHLHFQLIMDMEGKKGDYPGVCRMSDKKKHLSNCPDPNLILQMLPVHR